MINNFDQILIQLERPSSNCAYKIKI